MALGFSFRGGGFWVGVLGALGLEAYGFRGLGLWVSVLGFRV